MSYKGTLNQLIYDVLLVSYKSASGSRSSKRTDQLHQGFMDIISRSIDIEESEEYNILHEHTTKTDEDSKDTFSIDVLLQGKSYDIALLFKLITSSYNKNRNNYRDTTIGERFRFLANSLGSRRKLAHINILPRYAPIFDKHGRIKSVETVNPQNIEKWDDYFNFPNKPIEAKLFFEIDKNILDHCENRYNLYERMVEAGPGCITTSDEEQFLNKVMDFIKDEK
jgi:hypothetical protein